MSTIIQYKKRRKYKYTLLCNVTFFTEIEPLETKFCGLLQIDGVGYLQIEEGYAWDGPSGPTIDTHTFMRGSLIHDALYQLMREGKIGQDQRKKADQILREICLADGMSKVRAWWVYRGVRAGAAKATLPDLLTAP